LQHHECVVGLAKCHDQSKNPGGTTESGGQTKKEEKIKDLNFGGRTSCSGTNEKLVA
jgi:hypothetical protein